jgi:hypothetical protein
LDKNAGDIKLEKNEKNEMALIEKSALRERTTELIDN